MKWQGRMIIELEMLEYT